MQLLFEIFADGLLMNERPTLISENQGSYGKIFYVHCHMYIQYRFVDTFGSTFGITIYANVYFMPPVQFYQHVCEIPSLIKVYSW